MFVLHLQHSAGLNLKLNVQTVFGASLGVASSMLVALNSREMHNI